MLKRRSRGEKAQNRVGREGGMDLGDVRWVNIIEIHQTKFSKS